VCVCVCGFSFFKADFSRFYFIICLLIYFDDGYFFERKQTQIPSSATRSGLSHFQVFRTSRRCRTYALAGKRKCICMSARVGCVRHTLASGLAEAPSSCGAVVDVLSTAVRYLCVLRIQHAPPSHSQLFIQCLVLLVQRHKCWTRAISSLQLRELLLSPFSPLLLPHPKC
jgi:hypothetical protein